MAEEQSSAPTSDAAAGNAPQANILAQYVKDLSFENPSSPEVYQAREAPGIDVQFNIGNSKVADDQWEVVLRIDVVAKSGEQTAFQVELAYAGLFRLRNVPEQQIQPFLLVDAPHMLFPFARQVLANAVRDGNFPALMLDPIDFAGLYMRQQAQMAQGGSDTVDVPPPPTGNA